MIRYYKLFDMLNRKGLKKTDLLNVLTSGTLAKLSKVIIFAWICLIRYVHF